MTLKHWFMIAAGGGALLWLARDRSKVTATASELFVENCRCLREEWGGGESRVVAATRAECEAAGLSLAACDGEVEGLDAGGGTSLAELGGRVAEWFGLGEVA